MTSDDKRRILEPPPRSEIKPDDRWDLSSLFAGDEQWQQALETLQERSKQYAQYRNTLHEGPEKLAECLAFHYETERLRERLGTYAYLKMCEDMTQDKYLGMFTCYQAVATDVEKASAFIEAEIAALPDETLHAYMESEALRPYRFTLERLARLKMHILSEPEERLLAGVSELLSGPDRIFDVLMRSDIPFSTVKDDQGNLVRVDDNGLVKLLRNPQRSVRRRAFSSYFNTLQQYQRTLSSLYGLLVRGAVFASEARKFESSLHAALFPENIPVEVYHNLIQCVREFLPVLHRYYEVRRRKMRLRDIHFYDIYVLLPPDFKKEHSWDQAVQLVVEAMQPLGEEYCSVLEEGLRRGWCDKYPNRGKQGGAFSAGSYDGWPYILMNYQPEVIEHVFTLAHEAGHSMHSYYSSKTQPFHLYRYSLFTAEVASIFNEELLTRYLMDRAQSRQERLYYVSRQLDEFRGTLFRQTMFAEFELRAHEAVKAGEALTSLNLRQIYRELLDDYYGPRFKIDPELEVECLRIPHFYRPFYVYQYATGMSAAIALAEKVLSEGPAARDAYLNFLKSGGSNYPLELLRQAGVDMRSPEPVRKALKRFEALVDEFEQL